MTDFETVHGRLREILMRQRGDLAITKDELLAELEALTATSIPGFRPIAEDRAAARA